MNKQLTIHYGGRNCGKQWHLYNEIITLYCINKELCLSVFKRPVIIKAHAYYLNSKINFYEEIVLNVNNVAPNICE